MSSRPEPSLSVIVVTRDTYRTLRPIVGSLRSQTVADRVELVVVAPDEAAVGVPSSDATRFHSVRVVGVGPVTSRGRAAARGVHAARAPIVALCENHCFPEPGWAERTLARHQGDWAGVGPAVVNANPESVQSQALHAFGYGLFPRSRSPGIAEELPLHNSSYRKDVLPESIGELEELLVDERGLQQKLRARGHVLYFDPGPVKWHLNEATWRLLIGLSYESGRRYGTGRGRTWPWWKRALYAALTPVVSLPIARNVWTKLSAEGDVRKSVALAAAVWAIGLCHALGEAVAYVGGVRHASAFTEDEEFLIRGRLGGRELLRPEIAALVALLDEDPSDERSRG